MSGMRLLRAGVRALLAEVGTPEEAGAVYAAVRAAHASAEGGMPRVGEAVPGARSVLFDEVEDVAALVAFLSGLGLAGPPAPEAGGPVVEVPTTYDGPDLDSVARRWDRSVAEVVELHTRTDFVVAFCGFRPGFAYCSGLPAELGVPRLETPRARVPAGSVGLAGSFTGVYPAASPGGWRLVGRTYLTLWDPAADPPARLTPGTRVRFRDVGR